MRSFFRSKAEPAHTRWEGDGAIAVAVGQRAGDVDTLGEAAFVATARALESAIRATNGV